MNPAARRLAVFLLLGGLAAPQPRAQEAPPTPQDEAAAPVAQPARNGRPVLELSLDGAVERALQNNADIRVERLSPELSQSDITSALGAYDPQLSGSFGKTSITDPNRNVFSGGVDRIETDQYAWDFGVRKLFTSGASASLDFTNTRTTTSNIFSNFNPSFGATLTARVSQPLLRNLKIDATRQRVQVAKLNREISDAQFRQVVINTVAGVKKLYYDLIFAIDNLEAQRKNLTLAQKLLDENRIRVRVGTLAPLDVVAAESEVASREETVIVAENGLAEAEDALKRAIFPENAPDTWNLRVVPRDRPTAEPHPVDIDGAVVRAIEKRIDALRARKGLEADEITLRYARNQLKPQLDVVGSYGTTGQGGTRRLRQDPTDPTSPVVSTIPGGYGDAVSQVFGRDFPTWSLGVNVTYPLRNRQAEAQSARAQVSRDQAAAALTRLELLIASEVRTIGRAVETNYKRVESTRAAQRLAKQRLEAEEKRFTAGMSTNFLVTQAQRDLAVAEVAEVRAVADYRKSLIDFDRVQEAGLGGVLLAQ